MGLGDTAVDHTDTVGTDSAGGARVRRKRCPCAEDLDKHGGLIDYEGGLSGFKTHTCRTVGRSDALSSAPESRNGSYVKICPLPHSSSALNPASAGLENL